jgi:hypothetical protein
MLYGCYLFVNLRDAIFAGHRLGGAVGSTREHKPRTLECTLRVATGAFRSRAPQTSCPATSSSMGYKPNSAVVGWAFS